MSFLVDLPMSIDMAAIFGTVAERDMNRLVFYVSNMHFLYFCFLCSVLCFADLWSTIIGQSCARMDIVEFRHSRSCCQVLALYTTPAQMYSQGFPTHRSNLPGALNFSLLNRCRVYVNMNGFCSSISHPYSSNHIHNSRIM